MNPLSIECEVHFHRCGRGRKELEAGAAPPAPAAPGRVPRAARLLALAHRLERLVRTGVVRDYAELARLGRVTRARISQVMALLLLAPDIQEQILFLPRTERGATRSSCTTCCRSPRRRTGGDSAGCGNASGAAPAAGRDRPPHDAADECLLQEVGESRSGDGALPTRG